MCVKSCSNIALNIKNLNKVNIIWLQYRKVSKDLHLSFFVLKFPWLMQMTVTWTSGYDIHEAVPFVEWGFKGRTQIQTPAGSLTFHRNSMCGTNHFICPFSSIVKTFLLLLFSVLRFLLEKHQLLFLLLEVLTFQVNSLIKAIQIFHPSFVYHKFCSDSDCKGK